MDEMRAMLDQLMGQDRDLPQAEREKRRYAIVPLAAVLCLFACSLHAVLGKGNMSALMHIKIATSFLRYLPIMQTYQKTFLGQGHL
jgi:hypothetical protein